MTEVTDKNFGLLIAYVLPGFIALAGAGRFLPAAQWWLEASSSPVTVGGFLYGTLASVAVGLGISAVRWLVLDSIHHHSGVTRPQWNFAALQGKMAAFEGTIQNHYRYYQFYGNTLVAIAIATVANWPLDHVLTTSPTVNLTVVLALAVLFVVASRDALQKHYARSTALLPIANLDNKEIDDDQRLALSRQIIQRPQAESSGENPSETEIQTPDQAQADQWHGSRLMGP